MLIEQNDREQNNSACVSMSRAEQCQKREANDPTLNKMKLKGISSFLPARIAQLDRTLDLKTRFCGFDSRAGKPNKYCLSDETLNRGPVRRCCTLARERTMRCSQ